MHPKGRALSFCCLFTSILTPEHGIHFIKRRFTIAFYTANAHNISRITSHPNVDFTVVINPDSGPGNTSQYPNEAYTSGIQKLNAYQNVKTIGYVRTGYAIRDPNEVLLDISIYSGWAQHPNKSDIAMHGIFFDEVVYEYSEGNANYLKLINQAAKNASGLLSDKLVCATFTIGFYHCSQSGKLTFLQIVHNPGVVPDSRLQEPNTDVTVVFEQSYQKYSNLKTSLNDLSNNRTEYSYIVHSLPQDMGKGKLKSYVNDLSKRAKYLFVTDSNQGYYEKFGENWATFLDVFPS